MQRCEDEWHLLSTVNIALSEFNSTIPVNISQFWNEARESPKRQHVECSYADLHIPDVTGAVLQGFEPEGINLHIKRMIPRSNKQIQIEDRSQHVTHSNSNGHAHVVPTFNYCVH